MCYFYMTPTGCKDWDHNHPASLRDVGTPTNKRLPNTVALPKMGTMEDTFTLVAAGCPTPLLHPSNINLMPAEGQNAILHIDLRCHHIHQHRSCTNLPIDVVGIWIEGTNPMEKLSETNGIHRNLVTHCDTYGHGNTWVCLKIVYP